MSERAHRTSEARPVPPTDKQVVLNPGAVETRPQPPDTKPYAGSPAAGLSPSPEAIRVPGYDVVAQLGRGGMGVVYKGVCQQSGEVVAIKTILAGLHASDKDITRFRREAEVIARLDHPNIVRVHKVGDGDGLPYYIMEFCASGSLADKMAGRAMDPKQSAAIVETLARALAVAHDAGVVHRDLKPANVMLAPGRTKGGSGKSALVPKVTDFGLVKLLDAGAPMTTSGAVLGTPQYMAPEQAAGKTREVGPPTDVYALGVILFEMLTGKVPFTGETVFEVMTKVVNEPPVPPSRLRPGVPPALDAICLTCLQKAGADRYPSARELADDLARFRLGAGSMGRRPDRWSGSMKAIAIGAAAALMALAGGYAVVATRSGHTPPAAGPNVSEVRPAPAPELPAIAPPGPVKIEGPVLAGKKLVESKLRQSVSVEKPIENIPLRDLLDFFSDKYDLKFIVDEASFEVDYGRKAVLETVVKLPRMNDVAFGVVLRHVIEQAGGIGVASDNYLLVTTRLGRPITLMAFVRDKPLAEVMEMFHKDFGITIRLSEAEYRKLPMGDKVKDRPISLSPGKDMPVRKLLDVVCEQLNSSYDIDGDGDIVLSPGRPDKLDGLNFKP